MAAVNATSLGKSVPMNAYYFDAQALASGSNTITLPAPSLQGSFPPDGQWTPTEIWAFPYNAGAVGTVVTPDLATIANTAGQVTFNAYATGATNARFLIW